MIVRITISVVFVLALSSSLLFQYHNIYGQILNDKTLLDTTENQETNSSIVNEVPDISEINIGKEPSAIAINQYTNTVYVVNSNFGTVSVIFGENNTKVKDLT